MNNSYLRKIYLSSGVTVLLGICTGYIFCQAHVDSTDCALGGVPYLKSSLLGIGGIAFLLGLGGGFGLSARFVFTIIREPNLGASKYREMILDLAQCSAYVAIGFMVFIIAY